MAGLGFEDRARRVYPTFPKYFRGSLFCPVLLHPCLVPQDILQEFPGEGGSQVNSFWVQGGVKVLEAQEVPVGGKARVDSGEKESDGCTLRYAGTLSRKVWQPAGNRECGVLRDYEQRT